MHISISFERQFAVVLVVSVGNETQISFSSLIEPSLSLNSTKQTVK